MKSALVYDWFGEFAGGGEKTFNAIYELFPSPIYALLKNKKSLQGMAYQNAEFHTSFIEKMPGAQKWYSHYFPLFPMAIERFDLSDYDLILSCSHCVAKGVLTHGEQLHLCYCYTPVRYAWDLYFPYLSTLKGPKKWMAEFFLRRLRSWDLQSKVDSYGAISHLVARRIERLYGRKAKVIYPPVETDFFTFEPKKENFYLAASRLVSYKKIDMIVEAFNAMPDKKLVVIGDGPERSRIKPKKNVEMMGYQTNDVLKSYLQKAKAFVFSAVEDFGILPVEAQACGTPVIAYKKGAVQETVLDGKTGLFFAEPTVQAIVDAVSRFEKLEFDLETVRRNATRFNSHRFNKEFRDWVDEERQKRCELSF